MTLMRPRGRGAILATFAVALALASLPLPEVMASWRPAWVTMVLIYWAIALPERVGLAAAWVAGLFVDVLVGTLLGQHAIGLVLAAFVAVKLHLRMRVLPPWQQSLGVFVLVALQHLLVLWTRGMQGLPTGWEAVYAPAVTSALLWPWIFMVLRDVRRRYRVA